MKFSILVFLVMLAGCAHTNRAQIEARRQELIAQELRIDAMREKERAARHATEKFGTAKGVFEEAHGNPDHVEMYNGMTVYWYQHTDPPMYYAFKDDKLVSVIVDRETLREREDARRDYRDARLRQADYDARRREFLAGALLQTHQASKQKNVNCITTKMGDQAYTRCN